jgi:hypothetical protein
VNALFGGASPRVKRVVVDFMYENGVTWDDFDPEDFPDETWSAVTVYHAFTIEVEPDMIFIPYLGSSSELIVRPVEVDGETQFRLVAWRELERPTLGDSPRRTRGSSETFGSVKALYR